MLTLTSLIVFPDPQSVVDGPIGLTPRVKPFIAKLAHLLARPETYQDCIVWDAAGEAFILNASKRLTGEVFPRLFGHGTLASFTRAYPLAQSLAAFAGELTCAYFPDKQAS